MKTLKSEPVLAIVKEGLARGPKSVAVINFLSFLEARIQKGIQSYGEELHTFNGRDALADVSEELADALLYMTQYERECAVDKNAEGVELISPIIFGLSVSLMQIMEYMAARNEKT